MYFSFKYKYINILMCLSMLLYYNIKLEMNDYLMLVKLKHIV